MSTFKGLVAEFPDIRIDYFRPQENAKPALACFLSHIHSDHLQGLEGFYGGPFIYCSEATKELLVRLERRAHRLNLAKQIVECHDFTYANKKMKLKSIPLETPTMIELANNRSIRVTLFDANHCPGAVMFLIEDESHSVLYTGDIRAEPWWVETIVRHPILIPYTMGFKTLSRIYLDTSYASTNKIHNDFVSKADGIKELIEKISKYPKDTIFHINTWTFGYEDVWVAISSAFDSKIHVDKYLYKLFRAIRDNRCSPQGPYLNGFIFGNLNVEGRLTTNPEVRFHSCDRGTECSGLSGDKVVYVVPIVTRLGNVELVEPGLGHGDLESHNELALDDQTLGLLLNALRPCLSPKILELLVHANHSRSEALPLDLNIKDKIGFSVLIQMLAKVAESTNGKPLDAHELEEKWNNKMKCIIGDDGEFLPARITYPYSRHASYNELRNLIRRFRPKDIYPCTVDESWSREKSIQVLFGDLCSGNRFEHDEEMFRRLEEQRAESLRQNIVSEHGSYNEETQIETQTRTTDGEDEVDNLELQKASIGVGYQDGELFPQSVLQKRSFGRGSSIPKTSQKRVRLERAKSMASESETSDGEDITLADRASTVLGPALCSTLGSTVPMIERKTQVRKISSPSQHLDHKADSPLHFASETPVRHTSPVVLARRSPTHKVTQVSSKRENLRPKQSLHPESGSGQRTEGRETAISLSDIEGDDLDLDEVEHAAKAALGTNGATWWNLELISTQPKFRYQEEKEL